MGPGKGTMLVNGSCFFVALPHQMLNVPEILGILVMFKPYVQFVLLVFHPLVLSHYDCTNMLALSASVPTASHIDDLTSTTMINRWATIQLLPQFWMNWMKCGRLPFFGDCYMGSFCWTCSMVFLRQTFSWTGTNFFVVQSWKSKPREGDLWTTTGWWFGCHFLFSHILGLIIPIDEVILFRGVKKPPNRLKRVMIWRWLLNHCDHFSTLLKVIWRWLSRNNSMGKLGLQQAAPSPNLGNGNSMI